MRDKNANSTPYITVQGDTWDSIAYKLFGSEMYMHDILQLNSSYADVVIFSADVKIAIPKIERKIVEINPAPWA